VGGHARCFVLGVLLRSAARALAMLAVALPLLATASSAKAAGPAPGAAPVAPSGAFFFGRSLRVDTPHGPRTFTIERKLGQGVSGITFLARDRREAVAVKIARNTQWRSATIQGFDREARVLGHLEGADPGFPRTLGVGTMVRPDGGVGQRVLVMQLASGKPLGTQGDHEGTVWQTPRVARSPEMAARMMLRATDIVADMHDRGLAHRDVHPGNLRMVDGDVDSLRLIDFGSARPLDAKGAQRDVNRLGMMLAYLTTEGKPSIAAMPDVRRDVGGTTVTLRQIARRAIDGEYTSVRELHDALAPFAGGPAPR